MAAYLRTGLLVAGCFLSFSASAFEVAQEFSAEAVQTVPGHPSMNVKMFISKNAVRTESMMNGNMVIEIVYPNDKRRVLLNQHRKTYIEQKAEKNSSAKSKKLSSSPCSGILNATCKKLGKEKINGRNATKWEMTVQRNRRSFKSLHWLDKKHHMPLREQFPDGTVSTMTMSGKEKINGRNTEKWNIKATRSNAQSIESQQWYDPKLKMVIREILPGGYVRELRNIKVAKQNKSLFKVPSDYKKESKYGMMPPEQMTQQKMTPDRMNQGRVNQGQIMNPGRVR